MTDALSRLKAALASRYTIERELGSGGMATVYLAEDVKLHRKVAVKVLRPELAAALGPDRFVQEIDIAAKLTHPHILGLHDCGEADGFLYYVMPYVEGQSLRDKLAKEGELPIAEAVRILRDVVDALDHAHKHGVVHRDIKPDNVLLSERHALVTDFGVAKAVSEATGAHQLTTEGVALGTPAYMSPEQAAADKHIDHRADIYAVGAVAYELLTGRPPFTGTTPQELLSAQVTQTPDRVTKYRESVPPALEQLVMKCLEKKAADRWQTAEELLPQLEALATPSGGITPTDTRPVASVRMRRTRLAIGAAAVAALTIAAAIFLPRLGEEIALVPNRVVVGVFENHTGDPSLDQVGFMAADWITQELMRPGIIDVIPSPTALQSWRYVVSEVDAGRERDPIKALAEETSAGIVVSGAFYGGSEGYQFHTQITDARRGQPLYASEQVVGSTPEQAIGVLSQEVLGALAASLDERLAGTAGVRTQPHSLAAYQAYADGMELYNSSDWAEAIPHFYRAAELDSTFTIPLIYATWSLSNLGLSAEADSLVREVERHRDQLPPYDRHLLDALVGNYVTFDRERAYLGYRRAAEIAPSSKAAFNMGMQALYLNRPREVIATWQQLDPERGAMRGRVAYFNVLASAWHVLNEHEEELTVAREGRQLYPANPQALRLETLALAALGRTEELDSLLKEVEALPPGSRPSAATVMYVVVAELRRHGHGDAAQEALNRTIEWHESMPAGEAATADSRVWYGRMLNYAGRFAEAEDIFEALLEEEPENYTYRALLGVTAARRGDVERAEQVWSWLEQDPPRPWSAAYQQACIAALLGDRDRALSRLREAFTFGSAQGAGVHRDLDLEPLWDDPEFEELTRPKG
jgi:tetratricopeptide (TPR) repeat protein/tRNA A-37 threonylcarbamoyl transferase component Bud32